MVWVVSGGYRYFWGGPTGVECSSGLVFVGSKMSWVVSDWF